MQLLTTKELALLVGAQPGYRVVLTETEESGNRWWGMRIDLPQGKSYQIITTSLFVEEYCPEAIGSNSVSLEFRSRLTGATGDGNARNAAPAA
ncbi:hypothetical protein RAN76_00365 [Pseudomonas aeruginosa]|uniref:hypothetical protein n=1 Tax=Pseudomonas aeruginosa TaxID=287 RepID=UPI002FBEE9C3